MTESVKLYATSLAVHFNQIHQSHLPSHALRHIAGLPRSHCDFLGKLGKRAISSVGIDCDQCCHRERACQRTSKTSVRMNDIIIEKHA